MGRSAVSMIVALVASYLVLGAFAGLIYRTALGGLILGAGALVLLGLALAVAWASATRRGRATGSVGRGLNASAPRRLHPRVDACASDNVLVHHAHHDHDR